jgi:hypothetical protein
MFFFTFGNFFLTISEVLRNNVIDHMKQGNAFKKSLPWHSWTNKFAIIKMFEKKQDKLDFVRTNTCIWTQCHCPSKIKPVKCLVLLVGGPGISSVHDVPNKHSRFLIGNILIFPAFFYLEMIVTVVFQNQNYASSDCVLISPYLQEI